MSVEFDLQLFAEERTEPATPRKRQKAREKGQVHRSIELNSVVLLAAGTMMLYFFSGSMIEKYTTFLQYMLRSIGSNHDVFNLTDIVFVIGNTISFFVRLILPFMLVCFVAALMVNIVQVGFLLTAEPLRPNLNRFNPVEGIKRMFSLRSVVELAKSIAKAVIIGYVLYISIKGAYPFLIDTMKMSPLVAMIEVGRIVFWTVVKAIVVLLILAVVDYYYQRWEFEKNIRMTKQEIKDEYKQTEGDPQIKARIRRKQLELAKKRMMQELPKAEVVITNPIFIAVALRYDPDVMNAPVVVAKGQRLIAQKIKEIAMKYDIPIVENKPLARVLFFNVEVGEEIPPDLYQAVAEILAFVYNIKRKNIAEVV